MSTYTTKIRDYIESFTDWKNIDATTAQKIETGLPKLFDFSYPWYNADNTSRKAFERMFIVHFYMDEIGFETFGLFKLKLEDKLALNMPRYKALYDSNLEVAKILENVNMTYDDTDTSDGSGTGESSTSGSGESHSATESQNINSDTPQVNFSGADYASGMSRGQQKTDQNDSNSTNFNSKSTNTSVDTSHRTEKGWRGSKMNELVLYRDHIVNVNKTIIDDCEDLFMGVYTNFAMHGNDFNMMGYGNRGNIGLSIDWMR